MGMRAVHFKLPGGKNTPPVDATAMCSVPDSTLADLFPAAFQFDLPDSLLYHLQVKLVDPMDDRQPMERDYLGTGK